MSSYIHIIDWFFPRMWKEEALSSSRTRFDVIYIHGFYVLILVSSLL